MQVSRFETAKTYWVDPCDSCEGLTPISRKSLYTASRKDFSETTPKPSQPSQKACFGFPVVQAYTTPDGVEPAGKTLKTVKSVSKRWT